MKTDVTISRMAAPRLGCQRTIFSLQTQSTDGLSTMAKMQLT
jgi:hypothetical protein